MAKKGLMYYFTMSLSGVMVFYLFWANRGNVEKSKEFGSLEEMYQKFEGKKKLVTTNELRLMGERTKVEEVPEADTKNGYM